MESQFHKMNERVENYKQSQKAQLAVQKQEGQMKKIEEKSFSLVSNSLVKKKELKESRQKLKEAEFNQMKIINQFNSYIEFEDDEGNVEEQLTPLNPQLVGRVPGVIKQENNIVSSMSKFEDKVERN